MQKYYSSCDWWADSTHTSDELLQSSLSSPSPAVKFTQAVSNCIQTEPKAGWDNRCHIWKPPSVYVYCMSKKQTAFKENGWNDTRKHLPTVVLLICYPMIFIILHFPVFPLSVEDEKDWWNNELIRCLGSALISSSLEKVRQHGKTKSGGCSHTVSKPENN